MGISDMKSYMRYGVSSKYDFGQWNHIVYGPFETEEQAENWLHTEESDFRERELMSKSAAIKLAGRKAVENARNPETNPKTETPSEKRDSLLSRLVEKKEEAAQKSAEQEQVRQESEHSMDSYYCDNRTI